MKITMLLASIFFSHALYCHNFTEQDTLDHSTLRKIGDVYRFIYRSKMRIGMDFEIYDPIWFSFDLPNRIKCYTLSGELFFFVTRKKEFILIQTDFRRINFKKPLFLKMNKDEVIDVEIELWESLTVEE